MRIERARNHEKPAVYVCTMWVQPILHYRKIHVELHYVKFVSKSIPVVDKYDILFTLL